MGIVGIVWACPGRHGKLVMQPPGMAHFRNLHFLSEKKMRYDTTTRYTNNFWMGVLSVES